MAKIDTLPIFLSTYKLLLDLYQTTSKYDKNYKYSLGQSIQEDAMSMVRVMYRANHRENKVADLEDFLGVFELVKLQIRLSKDLNQISIKKMAHLSTLTTDIARQAAAWVKHEKQRAVKYTGTEPTSPAFDFQPPKERAYYVVGSSVRLYKEGDEVPKGPGNAFIPPLPIKKKSRKAQNAKKVQDETASCVSAESKTASTAVSAAADFSRRSLSAATSLTTDGLIQPSAVASTDANKNASVVDYPEETAASPPVSATPPLSSKSLPAIEPALDLKAAAPNEENSESLPS